MQQQGYLEGKELTPGQQGVVWGYVMDLVGALQSGLLANGVLIVDPAKGAFAVSPTAPGQAGSGNRPAKP
jgi:hypothetical protein